MAHWEERLLRSFATASGAVVLLSAVYYAYRLTFWISLIVAMTGVAAYAFLGKRVDSEIATKEMQEPVRSDAQARMFFRFVAFMDAALLAMFAIARTDRAIASPWDVLPWAVFPLYALSSFFLLAALQAELRGKRRILFLHAAVTWGVAVFVYRLGFGFDPFIHQATEAHILREGFILPKKPFYTGQYVSVAALSSLTRLPIRWIDEWLVPSLAVFLVPSVWWTGLRHGWFGSMPKLGLSALFLVPVAPFFFTVPYNLSVVLLVACVGLFALPDKGVARWLPMAIAFAALAIHPLIGIPLVLPAIVKLLPRVPAWVLAPAVAFALSGAFGIYAAMAHAAIAWPDAHAFRSSLAALFASPFDPRAPWHWVWFYRFLRLWPWAMVLFGIWGYRASRHRRPSRLLMATAAGCFFAAVILAVFIRLPGIIGHEQFEFPLRLVSLLPVFFLPGIALALERLPKRGAILAALAVVMAMNWYSLYPQRNPASHFTAYGMGKEELLAADLIEQEASGKPYAVLSHQMLAAAALRRFGFDRNITTIEGNHYFYAIPTGGPLYARFLRLLGLVSPRETLQGIFDYADVPQIFVAFPRSWDRLGWVERVLGAMASRVFSAGGIRVYRFVR